MDEAAFQKLRRVMPTFLSYHRDNRMNPTDLPEEIGLKLTNRCNLRCKHCFQWNEDGHHRDMPLAEQKRDLDFALIEELFAATRDTKPNLYLWGGEPLIYEDWDKFVDLLDEDPRWTAVCTNGLDIEHRIESILRVSRTLEMSVSIEGFQAEHDAIRGRNTFARTMRGIDLLLAEREKGRYHGEVTIATVIVEPMVTRLYEFLEFFERKGVDRVHLGFLWYRSPETAEKMDQYVTRHFSWVHTENTRPSWHAYSFHHDPAIAARLIEELDRINEREWKFKLRYNPALRHDEVKEFLGGGDTPAQGKKRCLAIHSRIDVLPNGDVVSCKYFPELRMGNLAEGGTRAVWHSERFQELRKTIDTEGLMPVCAKCNLLYTRGA